MTSKKPSGNWKSQLRQWIWHRNGCLCHGFTDSPPLPETVPLTAIAVEHPGARRLTDEPTTIIEGDLVEHRTTQPWPECHNQSMKHMTQLIFKMKHNIHKITVNPLLQSNADHPWKVTLCMSDGEKANN